MYRKIIGIYRNFDAKLLNSFFATVSELFLVLIAPKILFFFAIHTKFKILICLKLLISYINAVTA